MIAAWLFGPNYWTQPRDERLGNHLGVALTGKGRVLQTEASRTTIYLSQKVVGDSAFPFKPGDDVRITIDPVGKRLLIERAK